MYPWILITGRKGGGMQAMDEFFRMVGAIVCVTGGFALMVGGVSLMIRWAAGRCTNVVAISRILRHAREHGIDLVTGEPVSRREKLRRERCR